METSCKESGPETANGSNRYSFNFVETDVIARAVIELCRPWVGVTGHLLSLGETATVLHIVGDACASHCMVSNRKADSSR